MKTLEMKIAEMKPLFSSGCPDEIIRLRAERELAYEQETRRRRDAAKRNRERLANWVD